MNKNANKNSVMRGVWSFFTSIKLTIVILLCLAITSIIGTVIVQNQNPDFYIKVYGQFFGNLFILLDIFDMYHSWWFRMLMAGLCINIIACSVQRLSAAWKIIFPKNLTLKPDRIKSGAEPVAFFSDQSAEALADIVSPILARQFRFIQTRKTKTGMMLLAEKNRWTRMGVYIVHLSVLLLLLGGLIGSFFGFEGFVSIPEGNATDRIQLKNSTQMLTLPFAIKCDDFDISFYKNGMPREFKSRLTLIENNQAVVQKDIIVNDPLRYEGISIYQASYGEMPGHSHAAADLNSKTITLEFTALDSGMQYTRKLAMGESFNLPEGQGTFQLKSFTPAGDFRGRNIGDTLIAEIAKPGQKPIDIQLPLRFPGFDKMRRGYFNFDVANTHALLTPAETENKQYYTGLSVSKDPGVWVVYSGFILIIIGCFISFFMSHQQLMVEILPQEQRTRVVLSGTANKNKTGMNLKLNRLSKTILKKSSSQ